MKENEEKEKGWLSSVPKLVKVEIAQGLEVKDFVSFFSLNKSFGKLSRENSFWKVLFMKRFGGERRREESWKDLFKNRFLLSKWVFSQEFCDEKCRRELKIFDGKHENIFPQFESVQEGWIEYIESNNKDTMWETLVFKDELKQKARMEMLILKNEHSRGGIMIGAICSPEYKKEAANSIPKNCLARFQSSIGVISGHTGFWSKKHSQGLSKGSHFTEGFVIGLEIDPIERQFKYFVNGKQEGGFLKWDSINKTWEDKQVQVHAAFSICEHKDIKLKFRVSKINSKK